MNRSLLIGSVLLLFLVSARIPREPARPDLDGSLGLVFAHARQSGGQFGSDYVSSYGPAAWLQSAVFTRVTSNAVLLYDGALYLLIALGLARCAWTLPIRWRVALLVTALLLPACLNDDPQSMVALGVFGWGVLAWREAPWAKSGLLCLCLLAGAGKFTFFCAGAMTIVSIGLGWRGAFFVAAYVAGFVLTWQALGQRLANFPAWLVNSLHYSAGYSAANALPPIPDTWFAGVTLALCFLISLWSAGRGMKSRWPRIIFVTWGAATLYLAWKHGITRDNLDGFAVFAIVALFILPAVSIRDLKQETTLRLLALFCALTIVAETHPGYFASWPANAARRLGFNTVALLRPGHYLADCRQQLDAVTAANQLPDIRALVGNHTVDVFGFHQGLAVLNDLNYTPPPVCQGYQVFNRALSQLNENFYARRAPEFVLFRLETIDGRYPFLDDGPLLADLMVNYEAVTNAGGFLILRRSATPWRDARRLNDLCVPAVTQTGPIDWWRDLFWQPREAGVVVGQATYRAPESMLANGFPVGVNFTPRDCGVVCPPQK